MLNEELEIAEPSGPEYVVKNRLQPMDEAIHGWYRFVLGYPPHLVREYLKTLGADPTRDWVFDPFCGTATTPAEARLQGFPSISTDANPISILATQVKLSMKKITRGAHVWKVFYLASLRPNTIYVPLSRAFYEVIPGMSLSRTTMTLS